jgi:hypothetical protein
MINFVTPRKWSCFIALDNMATMELHEENDV